MAWTYINPARSRKDEIRFLIGDTNSDVSEQMLQDEEIDYVCLMFPISTDITNQDGTITIDRTRQPLMAALVCAEAIWMYFSRQADERLPPVNFEYAARAKNYKIVVDDLRMKVYTRGGLVPYAGGISIVDKITNVVNSDRVKPYFWRREDDNKATLTAERENLLDFV
jgi:hypothetical protein